MKASLVFLLVVGAVAADVGLGYRYNAPQATYGVPSYQFGGNTGQYSSAYSGNFGSGAQSLSGLDSTGYQGSGFRGADFLGTGYQNLDVQSNSGLGNGFYQSTGASSIGSTVQPAYQYVGNSGVGTGFQSQYSSSNQYQAAEKYQQHYQVQQQPTQVFKHFYVHAAPEEPETPKVRAPIVLPPAQKHYKIIFVKTPTENHRSQAIVPVQPQNEEKTIVYVLVKKPEDQHEVIVPKIEQKPPSKPEVYFIKYKNKEDSQAVINNIVKDYNKGEQLSVVNTGVTESSFNAASALPDTSFTSGISGVSYNTGSALNGASYNAGSGLNGASYTSGSGLSGISYNTGAGLSDVSYNTASGFGSVQYDPSIQSDVSSSSFGVNQGPAFTAGGDLSEVSISSSATPIVTVSTTASSIDYDGASAISTSQGVPHETYGPPKFRV